MTDKELPKDLSKVVGNRCAGRADELPEEWLEAVRRAEVPAEFAALNDELK
jgi:hypothetical protein